jgi:hypothetical protein
MNNYELPKPKGLLVGSIAPIFDTIDINDNKINLLSYLEIYSGVLIDFFIASW